MIILEQYTFFFPELWILKHETYLFSIVNKISEVFKKFQEIWNLKCTYKMYYHLINHDPVLIQFLFYTDYLSKWNRIMGVLHRHYQEVIWHHCIIAWHMLHFPWEKVLNEVKYNSLTSR